MQGNGLFFWAFSCLVEIFCSFYPCVIGLCFELLGVPAELNQDIKSL